MKRNVCFLCILTVLLAGCTPSVREVPFVFRKTVDQIVSVELLEVAPGPAQKAPCRVVAELDPEYYGLLIETAENTPCYTNYSFYNRDRSCCIRIRYADGETEVWIGSSVCVLTPEGEQNFLDIGFGESAVDNMVKMFLEMGEVAAQ